MDSTESTKTSLFRYRTRCMRVRNSPFRYSALCNNNIIVFFFLPFLPPPLTVFDPLSRSRTPRPCHRLLSSCLSTVTRARARFVRNQRRHSVCVSTQILKIFTQHTRACDRQGTATRDSELDFNKKKNVSLKDAKQITLENRSSAVDGRKIHRPPGLTGLQERVSEGDEGMQYPPLDFFLTRVIAVTIG